MTPKTNVIARSRRKPVPTRQPELPVEDLRLHAVLAASAARRSRPSSPPGLRQPRALERRTMSAPARNTPTTALQFDAAGEAAAIAESSSAPRVSSPGTRPEGPLLRPARRCRGLGDRQQRRHGPAPRPAGRRRPMTAVLHSPGSAPTDTARRGAASLRLQRLVRRTLRGRQAGATGRCAPLEEARAEVDRQEAAGLRRLPDAPMPKPIGGEDIA